MKMSHAVLGDMLAHAREEAPRECCGLLIGIRDVVERSVRAKNLAPQTTRYLIDPRDHLTAIRSARAAGREVIGAYHSHPASAPVPSDTDVAEAYGGSDFLYVIVSLVNNEARAYSCEDGAFVPLPLALVPLP